MRFYKLTKTWISGDKSWVSEIYRPDLSFETNLNQTWQLIKIRRPILADIRKCLRFNNNFIT